MHWCTCEQADSRNLGRPTIRANDSKARAILDFALEATRGPLCGQVFVAEMKCWLAAEKGRHLRLTTMDFADAFRVENPSFQIFLDFARSPGGFRISVKGEPRAVPADGAILIWSAVTQEGRDAARTLAISRVLSVEEMLGNLNDWNCESWRQCVARYAGWSTELFRYLTKR
jgi:hypothetical protein